MGKYALTKVLDFGKGKRVELYQEGKQIKPNGDFSLPEVIAEFKTPEEAKAFMQGAAWAVGYFGGDARNYGAESTENWKDSR